MFAFTHNSKGKYGLDQYHRNYVGCTKDKSDIAVVVGCWKVFLEENRFDGMENIKIWSDGGPKHFKISANIRFLLSLQQAQPEID